MMWFQDFDKENSSECSFFFPYSLICLIGSYRYHGWACKSFVLNQHGNRLLVNFVISALGALL
uniref:Uncharacterized protein n=1 Tax=Arundo donax TaxID=35708 RepID=A0A0A9HJT2_ARUDO